MSIIKEAFTPHEELTFALESLTSVMSAALDGVASIPDKLTETFPHLLRGFSGNEDLSKLPVIIPTTKEEAKFLEHTKKISYLEMRELKAYVPEGLAVTYLSYLTALKPVVAHLRRIVPDVLDPYAIFLATLVSNKNSALATGNSGFDHTTLAEKRHAAYGVISECFSDTNHVSETKIGSVVERNSDWVAVFNEIKNLVTEIKSVNRNTVMLLIDQCEDYLEIIYQNLKDHKLDAMTAEVALTLSQGAMSVACECEHFSVVYYRLLALEATIGATVNKVNSVLE